MEQPRVFLTPGKIVEIGSLQLLPRAALGKYQGGRMGHNRSGQGMAQAAGIQEEEPQVWEALPSPAGLAYVLQGRRQLHLPTKSRGLRPGSFPQSPGSSLHFPRLGLHLPRQELAPRGQGT
eukprot:5906802-Heterocapsa_arctica.AAC.1